MGRCELGDLRILSPLWDSVSSFLKKHLFTFDVEELMILNCGVGEDS